MYVDGGVHKAFQNTAIEDDFPAENIYCGIALGTISDFKLDILKGNGALGLNCDCTIDAGLTGALPYHIQGLGGSSWQGHTKEGLGGVVAILNVQCPTILADLEARLNKTSRLT